MRAVQVPGRAEHKRPDRRGPNGGLCWVPELADVAPLWQRPVQTTQPSHCEFLRLVFPQFSFDAVQLLTSCADPCLQTMAIAQPSSRAQMPPSCSLSIPRRRPLRGRLQSRPFSMSNTTEEQLKPGPQPWQRLCIPQISTFGRLRLFLRDRNVPRTVISFRS